MEFHRTRNLLFCSAADQDLDYVKLVTERVLARDSEASPRSPSEEVDCQWTITSGVRAAIIGVRLRGRVCCVKLFHDTRLRTKLRTALRLAKSRRAYDHGIRLHAAGIGCPKMIGYAERRPFGPTLLITELVEDGRRIDYWVRQYGLERQAVLALARALRTMHDRGIFHHDLSHRNLLVRRRGAEYEFLLLDYEDARFVKHVSQRRRISNIHHLHERVTGFIPIRDRLRFLRLYAGDDYHIYRNILRRKVRRSTWSRHHRPFQTAPSRTPGCR